MIENRVADDTDPQMNWETIEQLDVEVSNAGENDAEISLSPDSFREPFQEETLRPNETMSVSLLPFDEDPPDGSMLEVRAVIDQIDHDQPRMRFTNEIIEFEELSCREIQVDAVVDDEKVTTSTSCK
ncbi:hypothetical protein [Halobacteriaceae bacterium SHR40]|uniref:hypothetical protein n=1 Tax=Halovenus amylolytica TaxID=2500550 RepID=UPI000FE2FDE1